MLGGMKMERFLVEDDRRGLNLILQIMVASGGIPFVMKLHDRIWLDQLATGTKLIMECSNNLI
jgi:hypothetical protein